MRSNRLLLVGALATSAALGGCAQTENHVGPGVPSLLSHPTAIASADVLAPRESAAPEACGPPTSEPKTASDKTALASTWGGLSGASGDGVADGTFGQWRGTALSIAGTWNDSYEAQTVQCTLLPGYEFGEWQADLDVAIGAIFRDRGETWAAASAGAYEDRWRTALNAIDRARGTLPGTLHLRFAHEFNIDSSPWHLQGSEIEDFLGAWRRFRALQREILPASKLVFCPNDRSSRSLSLDWRRAFPGREYVDEMGVDSYFNGGATTTEDFLSWVNRTDGLGAPVGLERHRQFAESVGLPLAVPEWGSNARRGESPVFIREFRSWLSSNAGTGPGQVPYEIVFNVGSFEDSRYALFPDTLQPDTAATYVALF